MNIRQRTLNAITSGCFNARIGQRVYYGHQIAVGPLFCSYGQIGVIISFPYQNIDDIQWDWELNKIN